MEGKQHLHDLLGSLGRPLPEYRLVSKGGVDHQPLFVCSCSLIDEDKLVYMSDPLPTKQKAENQAAMKAYEDIQKKDLKTTVQIAKSVPISNFKGSLQEYCQKNALPIPSYSNFSSPPSIRNHYGSSVVAGNKTFRTTEYYTTQKAAQQAVAEKAYMCLVHNVVDGEPETTPDREELEDLSRKVEETTLESPSTPTPIPFSLEPENTNTPPVPIPKKLPKPVFISDNAAVNKIQNSETTGLFRKT